MLAADHETMDIDERYKLIRNFRRKYEATIQEERSQILNTMLEAAALMHKHVIILPNRPEPHVEI